jgi:hypothetical protein
VSLSGNDAPLHIYENSATKLRVGPEFTPDERDKYVAWWRKFKMIERLHWGGLLGVVLLSWLNKGQVPSLTTRVVMFGCVIVWLAFGAWFYRLTCPRCGAIFSGGLVHALFDRFYYPRKCYGCELSRSQLKRLAAGELW